MRGRPPPTIRIGSYGHRWWSYPVTLTGPEITRHLHVHGKSGYGKSRFLAHWFLSVLDGGYSATVIDPQGDLARLILCHLVARGVYQDKRSFSRIRYLDIPAAEAAGSFLPLNVLKSGSATRTMSPHTIARNVRNAFHRAWPELAQGAATFDTLVRDGVKVLVSNGLAVTQLYDVLTDGDYRARLLTQEPDAEVVKTFTTWYDRFTLREQADIAGAALRRARELTFSPFLRASLGADAMSMDFRELMDANVSTIVKLDLQDADDRRLLECLFTVAAEQGALSRSELPPGQRFGAHFLMLDEFHEMVDQSEKAFTTMLSGTRKFGLFCVLANQTWSQTSQALKDGLQNVDIEVVFRLGRQDANYSAQMLGSVIAKTVRQTTEANMAESAGMAEQWEEWKQRLMQLPIGQAVVRTPSGAVQTVRIANLPDPMVDPGQLAAIEERYLKTYFRPVERQPNSGGNGSPAPAIPRNGRRVRLVADEEV